MMEYRAPESASTSVVIPSSVTFTTGIHASSTKPPASRYSFASPAGATGGITSVSHSPTRSKGTHLNDAPLVKGCHTLENSLPSSNSVSRGSSRRGVP